MFRRSIYYQILLPTVALLLLAILANVLISARLAGERAASELESRATRIAEVVTVSNFPLTENVLLRLKQLTAGEFLVWDPTDARAVSSTLQVRGDEQDKLAIMVTQPQPKSDVTLAGVTYKPTVLPVNQSARALVVLTPIASIDQARWIAIWPAFISGLVTLVLLVPMVMVLSRMISQRLESMRRKIESIATGAEDKQLEIGPWGDELANVASSVNRMSQQLQVTQAKLQQSERARLVGQLSAGFAHQVRNALAAARMSIQLHGKRCPSADEPSLPMALQQLQLVEQELHGILSLGQDRQKSAKNVDWKKLWQEATSLVTPILQHHDVTLVDETRFIDHAFVGQPDLLRSALLNLIQNAIEAVGPGGMVKVRIVQEVDAVAIEVRDSGAGFEPDKQELLADPFITTKPEGIGLGLTIVKHVAELHRGQLTWHRTDGETVFQARVHSI